MKKVTIFISGTLLLMATGCSKFLDKEPDNRAKLTTPEKVSQLLTSAYPQGNYQQMLESRTDNVSDVGTLDDDKDVHDAYYWVDSKETQQDSPEWYWFACYNAIGVCNEALDYISKVDDPENYQAQKGEALVARAYSHFMLVSIFANTYNAATAGADPGIPYVTEPETVVIKQYQRGTVKTVYDNIEKDLLEGINLIQDKNYAVPKFHFTRQAAYAFATRFYLFKKDYANVLKYGTLAFPGNSIGANLRGWNSEYANITDVSELFKIYASSGQAANLLIAETQSLWSRNFYGTRFCVSKPKMDEIRPTTDRISRGNFAYAVYGILEQTHQLMPKIDEYFVRASVNAEIGYPYVMVPLLSAEEVLFNRAEANAYLGNTQAALDDLNAFVAKRIRNYSSILNSVTIAKINSALGTNNDKDALVQAILYYKRPEFLHEGLRWFDILRYNLPVTHNFLKGSVNSFKTLEANDPKRIVQLPAATVAAGLAPNPR